MNVSIDIVKKITYNIDRLVKISNGVLTCQDPGNAEEYVVFLTAANTDLWIQT